jgi:FixJ family two-component response regulator
MTTHNPTVFVVDDNLSVRNSLQDLLESVGLAAETYATSEEFLAAFDPGRPGCLLLDIRLKHANGLDLQDELQRRGATLPVVILTGHGSVPHAVRALKAGAVDFLRKPMPPKLLVESVRAAIERDRVGRAEASQRTEAQENMEGLTPREREVMDLLVEGKSSKEIATALGVSVRTVEGHRRQVFSKMNAASAAHLVALVLPAREQRQRRP